jgi:hypothetical protein
MSQENNNNSIVYENIDKGTNVYRGVKDEKRLNFTDQSPRWVTIDFDTAKSYAEADPLSRREKKGSGVVGKYIITKPLKLIRMDLENIRILLKDSFEEFGPAHNFNIEYSRHNRQKQFEYLQSFYSSKKEKGYQLLEDLIVKFNQLFTYEVDDMDRYWALKPELTDEYETKFLDTEENYPKNLTVRRKRLFESALGLNTSLAHDNIFHFLSNRFPILNDVLGRNSSAQEDLALAVWLCKTYEIDGYYANSFRTPDKEEDIYFHEEIMLCPKAQKYLKLVSFVTTP